MIVSGDPPLMQTVSLSTLVLVHITPTRTFPSQAQNKLTKIQLENERRTPNANESLRLDGAFRNSVCY